MPHSQVSVKQQLKALEFNEWLKAFESFLKVNRSAWKTLQLMVESEEAFARVAQVPWRDDCRGRVLRKVHSLTSPGFDYEKTRKNNAETRRLLKSVLPQLKSLASHVQRTGTNVVLDDGFGLYDLSDLLKASESVQHALGMLSRPYTRAPKAINQCLPLLMELDSIVPESQALAIARLAMKAHGYRDGDLDCLSEDKVRAGHLRKRKAAHLEKGAVLIGLSTKKRNK
jgi:hypothetical protein